MAGFAAKQATSLASVDVATLVALNPPLIFAVFPSVDKGALCDLGHGAPKRVVLPGNRFVIDIISGVPAVLASQAKGRCGAVPYVLCSLVGTSRVLTGGGHALRTVASIVFFVGQAVVKPKQFAFPGSHIAIKGSIADGGFVDGGQVARLATKQAPAFIVSVSTSAATHPPLVSPRLFRLVKSAPRNACKGFLETALLLRRRAPLGIIPTHTGLAASVAKAGDVATLYEYGNFLDASRVPALPLVDGGHGTRGRGLSVNGMLGDEVFVHF